MTVRAYKMFIGGNWVDAASGETIPVIFPYDFPYDQSVWASVPAARPQDVDRAVQAARRAFLRWKKTSPQERGRLLRKLAQLVLERTEELARLETLSNGKLLAESRSQMRAVGRWLEFYATLGEIVFGETIPLGKPNTLDFTVREPYGVVAALVPWNSPLMLMTYKVAPALATGNTVVVKPAEQTPVTALEFASLVVQAGFPPGVLNVVTGGPEAGSALVNHDGVDKIAFTGGTHTGRIVARDAGWHLTPVTLELGGKSPNIVFADADYRKALVGVVRGIFSASGQTCRAGSRLLVEDSIADRLVAHLVEVARKIKMGNPLDEETQMGPIVSEAQLQRVDELVRSGIEEGARLLTGGARVVQDGRPMLFYPPTILDQCRPDMRVAQEEVFGPVLCVFRFRTEEECVELANQTCYGLGAGVWTRDLNRALRMVESLEAGSVWVNTYREVSHLVPFGGYKDSGYGRENGLEALREFTKIKNVWIDYSEEAGDPFVLQL